MIPKISVIIPVYNSGLTLKACLESLQQQSLRAEIIVVDDGSVDNTQTIVKEFSQVKLFSQVHSGPGAARNLGAKKATGEILVFIDSDMTFDQDFLSDLIEPIVKKQARGSWSSNELVSNWDNLWARCWNYNQNRVEPKMTGSPGQHRVFRAILKSEFMRVQGFDSVGYNDDWSLVDKLGYQPVETRAKFYHQNPGDLILTFNHSRWLAKRKYKFGFLGTIFTIFKSNLAFSVLIGFFQVVKFKVPQMLIFRLVYDLGVTLGALENLCFGSYY